MLRRKIPLNLWNLVSPLTKTFDLMNHALGEHGLQVAYLAMRIAEELDWPAWRRREAGIAGALHDIGAFSLAERLELLEFETTDEGAHARAGYLLLRGFKPFERIAEAVLYHHLHWENGAGVQADGNPVPEAGHLLHLADRTAVLLRKDLPVLGQISGIRASIRERSGSWFVPAYVDALLRLCDRDYIWLEISSGAMEASLRHSLGMETIDTDIGELLDFSRLLCRIIDFKSEFTATHSSGVAAAGKTLAALVGFSREECAMFEIAAYLHDLGKLAIPSEILEKRDRLTPEEWNIMRSHVYHTYRILEPIEVLNLISSWSSLHQERLDGSGYPFHVRGDELPLGARIMAVADVFTGLTENRPYRPGMAREGILEGLREMAARGELDARLVSLLGSHFNAVHRACEEAQAQAVREYEAFRESLKGGASKGKSSGGGLSPPDSFPGRRPDKTVSAPKAPPEESETIRNRIRALLEKGPRTAREISIAIRQPEQDIESHLEHLRKSLHSEGLRLERIPAECRGCGFVFRKRGRLKAPGRCPVCKEESISGPIFRVKGGPA